MDEQLDRRSQWSWIYSALEVGGAKGLGGNVRLDLHPQTTVLVGRNGVGKSALMDAMLRSAHGAAGVVRTEEMDPLSFACEVLQRPMASLKVRYECRWTVGGQKVSTDNALLRRVAKTDAGLAWVEESCRLVSADHEEVLWQLKDGHLLRNDGSTDEMPPTRGLINWVRYSGRGHFVFNAMVDPLNDLFLWRLWHLRASILREGRPREPVALPHPWPFTAGKRFEASYSHVPEGIRRLARLLTWWHERQEGELDAFCESGRRLGLFRSIGVDYSPNPRSRTNAQEPVRLASVTVDGVNLGLLSDGTLRVMTVLVGLVDPKIDVAMIEEPELALHPGLIGRLLAEIETASKTRQFVISTHSPQIVSWARPEAIRLVERNDGVTSVRALNEQQVDIISRYLHDEGSLGDYVFGGGVDE